MRETKLKRLYETVCSYKMLEIVLFLLIIAPFLFSTMLSIPTGDDFSTAVSMKESPFYGKSLILTCAERAVCFWKTWGGGILPYFLEHLINPMNSVKHYAFLYRVIMPIFFLLFIGAFMLFAYGIARYFFGMKKSGMRDALILLMLFTFLNAKVFTEVYYWFVGASYMQGITVACLTYYLMLVHYFGHKDKTAVKIGIILAGSYVAWNFAILIPLYLVYATFLLHKVFLQGQRLDRFDVILFPIYFVQSLFAILAPGNYVRHGELSSSGINLWDACLDTLSTLIHQAMTALANPVVSVFFVFAFFVGAYVWVRHEKSFGNPAYLFMLVTLVLAGVLFPLAVGYGNDEVPNRIEYLFYAHFMFGNMVFAASCGNKAAQRFADIRVYALASCIIFSVVIMNGFETRWFFDSPYYMTATCIAVDDHVYDEWMNLYNEVQYSQEQDVVVVAKNFPSSFILRVPDFSEDPSAGLNQVVAEYFGKKSLAVLSENAGE